MVLLNVVTQMVFIRFKQRDSNGKLACTMNQAQAHELDQVMKGLLNGSAKQRQFAANVRKIYWAKETREVPMTAIRLPYKENLDV